MRNFRNFKFDEVHNNKTIGTFEGTMVEGLKMSSIDMRIDDMMDISKVNGFLSVYLEMMDKLDEIDHLAIPEKSLFSREKCYRMDRPITLTGDPLYREEELQWMMFAIRSVSLTLRGKGRRFYNRRQTSWIKTSMKWYIVECITVYYNSYAPYSDYLAYLCGQIIGKYMQKKFRSHKKMAPKQEHVQLRVPTHLQNPVPVQMCPVQEEDVKLRYQYGAINE